MAKTRTEDAPAGRLLGINTKPVEHNAEILEIEYLSETLARFRIRPEETGGRIIDFVPGQYMTLGDNNPAGSTRRAYSIASPPSEKRWFELFIRRVSEENAQSAYPLTHILFDRKPGDGLWVGPKIVGRFTLEHTLEPDDNRIRVFVAAGTGLAPFVSIIDQAIAQGEIGANGEVPPYLILHGTSYPHELGYRGDLEKTLNKMGQLGYIPTVSRPNEVPDWLGDIGRVETFFDGEKLEKLEERLGKEPGWLTPANAVVYICGLQGTIANTIRSLVARGFVPDNRAMRKRMKLPPELLSSLFFEQYDSAPILDVEEAERLGSLLLSDES